MRSSATATWPTAIWRRPCAGPAPALRRGLHQLGKPWYRTRAAKDDLVGEDIRQHRRTRTIARAAVATLIVLLVAALVSAVIARANAVRGTW